MALEIDKKDLSAKDNDIDKLKKDLQQQKSKAAEELKKHKVAVATLQKDLVECQTKIISDGE